MNSRTNHPVAEAGSSPRAKDAPATSVARCLRIFPLFLAACLAGCSSLPKPDATWSESRTVVDTRDTTWARSLEPDKAKHGQASGIQFLTHGQDALAARLA